MKKSLLNFVIAVILLVNGSFLFAQQYGVNLDTVKSTKYDMGRMWTFDYPPVDYFSSAYGFSPSQDWFDDVRMSALRFATYCSASFVSGDGLVMTNHHCGRDAVSTAEKEGEDLHKDGFLAMKLEDERKIDGLFVDQLVRITDVTKEVQDAIEKGSNPEEKVANKTKVISEIEKRIADETGNRCQVVTLYNGGLYSAYVYKRYTDVRLVFAPEDQAGFFGGDPDNFTYPRYNLDVTFFRVYDESGAPLKTDHYFKWSSNGPVIGEPIFVVGNPGRTERLNTVAQLEFRRDYAYPDIMNMLNMLVDAYNDIIKKNPDRAKELNNTLFGFANSQKVYKGMVKALNDPVLMAKKKHFEKTFRSAVESNPSLKSKYGKAWDEIASINRKLSEIYPELYAFSINPRFSGVYFAAADKMVSAIMKNETLADDAITGLYKRYDKDLDDVVLKYKVQSVIDKLGRDNEYTKTLTNGKTLDAAIDYIHSKSLLKTPESALELWKKGPDAVKSADDPVIKFIVKSYDRITEIRQTRQELSTLESVNRELLGRAVYEVYGTTIPPDATFTLRISDGVVGKYEYNGTIAPPYTTFYGMYDRYYSFGKEFPWSLAERWLNPPKEFDLETPFNFISSNDIIGGNSGSPVINANKEVVGLAFDGNIESLSDNFIYTDSPHTVSVDSRGLLEAVRDLFKVKRLAEELQTGKLYTGD